MNTTGRLCKIDSLGRIVIPKQVRKQLGLHDGSVLELSSDDSKIVIVKHKKDCIFCHKEVELTEFEGKFLCKNCLKKLRDQE